MIRLLMRHIAGDPDALLIRTVHRLCSWLWYHLFLSDTICHTFYLNSFKPVQKPSHCHRCIWVVRLCVIGFVWTLSQAFVFTLHTNWSEHPWERERKLLSTAPKCFHPFLYCATYFDVTIEFDILYISSRFWEVVGIPGCLMCYWNICLRSSATFNLPLFISFCLIYFFTFTYLLNLITP